MGEDGGAKDAALPRSMRDAVAGYSSVGPVPHDDDPRYGSAHAQVFNPLVTLIGQGAYALVCGFIYWLYVPVAPDDAMRLWTYLAIAVFSVVAAFDVAFVIRRPDKDELLRFWRKVDKRIPMAFDVLAVGVLLLLYPHGHESLKILTVAFFVGYVPLQMISDPENESGNQFSTVTVLGAFALTLALNGDFNERVLAAMMVIYGAVLFFSSSVLRRVVISAVDGRLESERAARELELALADVSAAHEAKTRFIAAASHDLGQPLQAASLFFAQVMQAKSRRNREYAAEGVREAFAAADLLLSHMLNHLSLRADAVSPRTAPLHAGDLMRKLARQQAAAAKESGLTIRTAPSSRAVVTDAALAERLLGNFLSNAIVHSGGTRILLGLRRDGPNHVRFWVIDNGQGVHPSDANHIFDDYFKGVGGNSRAKGGFGIGLASARRIAALLGGEAGLDRRRGRGAAFFLRLPVSGASR